VFNTLQDLQSELMDYTNGVRGVVRVCASFSTVVDFLPEDIASFGALHPNISIELQECPTPDVVRAVVEGRADIGIGSPTVQMADLELSNYRKDDLMLVVPRNHEFSD